MSKLTFDEWVIVGRRVKAQYNESIDLHIYLAKKRLTTKQTDRFFANQKTLISLKSRLEAAMFEDIGHDYLDTHGLLDVFYGPDEPVEPVKRV